MSCKRCGLPPDQAIHRLHPGNHTHAYEMRIVWRGVIPCRVVRSTETRYFVQPLLPDLSGDNPQRKARWVKRSSCGEAKP
jgi:hypothetical protein